MTASGHNFGLSLSFDSEAPAVTVIGPLDGFTAPIMTAALHAVGSRESPLIVLDLRGASSIDGSGAQAIFEAGARARRAGQTVEVRSPATATHPAVDQMGADSSAPIPQTTADLLDASLRLVTSLVDATVANSVGTSITMERHGRPITVAASKHRVVVVDHHQYETGQGPCLDAKTYGQPFYIESLAEETRWPAFVPLALHHGVRSILSSPIRTSGGAQGSLNVYASVERAFGGHERQLAALCASASSHLLTTSEQDATDPDWSRRFTAALGARRTIHQAQGIIMARDNISGRDALERIMKAARTRELTADAYASQIVNAFHDPGSGASDRSTS